MLHMKSSKPIKGYMAGTSCNSFFPVCRPFIRRCLSHSYASRLYSSLLYCRFTGHFFWLQNSFYATRQAAVIRVFSLILALEISSYHIHAPITKIIFFHILVLIFHICTPPPSSIASISDRARPHHKLSGSSMPLNEQIVQVANHHSSHICRFYCHFWHTFSRQFSFNKPL